MKEKIQGHAAMIGAEVMWGAGAPVGKFILAGGIAPMLMTEMRMVGAALLFWLLSFFCPRQNPTPKDMLSMFFASMLGIVINQSCFMWGLSLTSPINASIITTSMPIVTMVLAAIFLREPVTRLKLGGVFVGALGALILVMGTGRSGGESSPMGDVLILTAQVSFACYLVFYKSLIGRYSVVTLMKWMFTYASIVTIPFTYTDMAQTQWADIDSGVLLACAAFVVGPTFISYLLLPVGQRTLRPTVTAMYNYVQPVVATLVAIACGMDRFTIFNAVAVVLVFAGVSMVTKSRSL